MKIITEDFQVEFAPDEREAAVALAIVETIRKNGNGHAVTQADVLLLDDVLAALVTNGHSNGNGVSAPESGADDPLTSTQRITLNWLISRGGDGTSVEEVAKNFNIRKPAAYARLHTLETRGYVEWNGPSHYRACVARS